MSYGRRAGAAKLALECDTDLDGLKASRSQRHKAMLDVIEQLEREGSAIRGGFVPPTIGHTSDARGYPAIMEHSDLTRPSWRHGPRH